MQDQQSFINGASFDINEGERYESHRGFRGEGAMLAGDILRLRLGRGPISQNVRVRRASEKLERQ